MTEQTNKAKLYAKIALIAGSVGSVAKDGYNPQLKYRYPTPATVIEAVKPLLVERGLAIVPTITNVVKEPTGSKTQSGAEKVLTRVEMLYLILDGESGESLSVPWVGEGEDWSDKGIAKAQTIALRTFLLNLFQIPSGDDDPDAGQQPPAKASYERPAPVKALPATDNKPTVEQLIAGIKLYWQEERKLGGFTPSEEILALDSASYDGLIELGKAAKKRVKHLQAKAQEASEQPPQDAVSAETRFFARYSDVIHGSDWKAVQAYLQSRAPKPTTVEGWIAAAEAIRDKAQEASEQLA